MERKARIELLERSQPKGFVDTEQERERERHKREDDKLAAMVYIWGCRTVRHIGTSGGDVAVLSKIPDFVQSLRSLNKKK